MAAEQKEQPSFSKKVLVIGGNGTIGKCVVSALETTNFWNMKNDLDIYIGSRSESKDKLVQIGIGGIYKKDKDNKESLIKSGTDSITDALKDAKYDWVICCAGNGPFKSVKDQNINELNENASDKLFGQVNLVIQCNKYLADNGCIVLTSGFLADYGMPGLSALSGINGFINSYVRSAALEMERGIKLNAVSPAILTESIGGYGPYMPGSKSVDGKDVARAYIRALASGATGQILEIIGAPEWVAK